MTTAAVEGSPVGGLMADMALELRGVSSGYGATRVLRDVDLRVRRGAVTALLGPNGAGKSTLLQTVSGFLPATTGSILLLGNDVTRARPHRRARAGLCHVPEGRGVFRGLTVRENLDLQAPGGAGAEALERATEAFPVLAERLEQRAGTLSGGQQQMLAMAAAYVRSPELVLVDEASLGLAPMVVDEIFGFLEERTRAGAALLIVDQFVHRALAMATDAFVLTRGRITYEGSAGDLLGSDLFARYVRG